MINEQHDSVDAQFEEETGLAVRTEEKPLVSEGIVPLTPEQARINSVANTMSAAMSKASTLELTEDEVKALQAEFPDEAFKTGAGGKANLIYIEHAYLRDRFTEAVGMGQWAILLTRPHWAEEFKTSQGKSATRIYAACALLIRGCMVAEAIGEMVYYPNNPSQNYGDAAEGAVTAAFRRCAKNFGVGLQAWKSGFCEEWFKRRGKKQPPTQQGNQGEPPGGYSQEKPDFMEQHKDKIKAADTEAKVKTAWNKMIKDTKLTEPEKAELLKLCKTQKESIVNPNPEITEATQKLATDWMKKIEGCDSVEETQRVFKEFHEKDEKTVGTILADTVYKAVQQKRYELDQSTMELK